MTKTKIPLQNIYWERVTKYHKVERRGNLYFVTDETGARFVAFWTGRTAETAQRYLDRAVWRSSKKKGGQ